MSTRVAPLAAASLAIAGAGVGAPAAALVALVALAFFAGLGAAWGAGVAAWGAEGCSFWIAAQMRAVAFARFSNFFTGFRSPKGGAPAKKFETSTNLLMGHSAEAVTN